MNQYYCDLGPGIYCTGCELYVACGGEVKPIERTLSVGHKQVRSSGTSHGIKTGREAWVDSRLLVSVLQKDHKNGFRPRR